MSQGAKIHEILKCSFLLHLMRLLVTAAVTAGVAPVMCGGDLPFLSPSRSVDLGQFRLLTQAFVICLGLRPVANPGDLG